MIKVSEPYFDSREREAVARVIASGNIASGVEVKKFEEEFAKHVGKNHAIAVSSGTAALMAAMMDLDCTGNIIVPAFSFPATAIIPDMFGGTLVFADIMRDYSISLQDIKNKITPMTDAVIPVHLYGRRCEDMDEIYEVCCDNGVSCIVDSCQAPSRWSATPCDIACYSFYATKNITTGEGGMIVTDDGVAAESMRQIINHGQIKKYTHTTSGINLRLTDIAAAMGRVQLDKYDDILAKRKHIAKYYSENIVSGVVHKRMYEDNMHDYHQYVVNVNPIANRDKVQKYLYSRDIETAVHYPMPIYKQPLFRNSYKGVSCRMADSVSKVVLSLPCHPGITQEQLEFIVETINDMPIEVVA